MPTNLLGHAPASQWHQVMINGVRFDAVTVVDVLDHVTMSIQTDAPGGLILTVNTDIMRQLPANPDVLEGSALVIADGVSATNIALAGGMITLADVRRGKINHAMSVAIMDPAPYTQISWPAQRSDGHPASKGLIREGQRLRLDPTLDLSKYDLTPMGRMVAEAAQTYGFIVTDKSGAVAVPTESGFREKATTGKNPWDTLLTVPDYKVLENFPWDKPQFMPLDYGRP